MILNKNISELRENERFSIINSSQVDIRVLEYLKQKFQNLTIGLSGKFEGNLIDLMRSGKLEGWCWQTTESGIVFLNDDDYIERGKLKFRIFKEYFHSWICFKFEDKEYVLDPCLNILCEKNLYHEIFEIKVDGRVTSKEVKDALIYELDNPFKDEESNYDFLKDPVTREIVKSICGYNSKKDPNEVDISGNDDINSPMFRNSTKYKVELEDEKIKKLTANYYYNCW